MSGIAPRISVGEGKGWKMNAGDGNKYAAAYTALLKNAVLVASEQNRDKVERQAIPFVHHFYAPMSIGDKEYVARLVVKEASDGTRFYDFDTSDEISPANPEVSGTLPKEGPESAPSLSKQGGTSPSARLNMSMSELLTYVKAEHGGTDPRFVRYAEGQILTETITVDGVERQTKNSGGDSYVAFDRSQIKSATGNSGDFVAQN